MSTEKTPIEIGRFVDFLSGADYSSALQNLLISIQIGTGLSAPAGYDLKQHDSAGVKKTDCLIVDAKARILDYSHSALTLLRSGGPLRIDCRQCLVATAPQQTQQLHNQIGSIAKKPYCAELHIPVSDVDVWKLQLLPLSLARQNSTSQLLSESVFIVIQRRLHRRPPGKEVIRCRLLCTQAEASVAAELANGLSPQQIAALRNVSINTVRSQVRALLAHTGAKRISEFVSIVSGL